MDPETQRQEQLPEFTPETAPHISTDIPQIHLARSENLAEGELELAIPSDMDPSVLSFILEKADKDSQRKFIERPDMGVDDCATELTIAGIKALHKYNPEKGTKLETYVNGRMDKAFIDVLRDGYVKQGQPRSAYNKIKNLEEGSKERKDMEHKLVGEGVVIHPVATSLDEPLSDSAEAITRLDKIASSRQEVDPETAESKELEELIYDCKDLTRREQDIALKYLVGNMTLKEISLDYNVTESRISQLWTKSLEKLKVHLAVSGSIQTSPQEKVYNWMGSLKDHELLHETDIRFAQNQLPNLFIHYDTTEKGTDTILTLTIKKYDEERTSLLRAHGLLNQFTDVSIYELEGKHAIRLVLPEKLTEPVDLQTVASIDHLLNFHDARKNQKPMGRSTLEKYHEPTSQWLVDNLPPKALEVISNMSNSNEDIAENMSISKSTVRTHLHNASNATGLTSEQLCLLAYEVGMLDFDEATDKAIINADFVELTPTEQRTLQQVADGNTYKEAAANMSISVATIRTHLHNSYSKLSNGEATESRKACLVAYANGKIVMPKIVVQFMKSALNDTVRDSLAELVKD